MKSKFNHGGDSQWSRSRPSSVLMAPFSSAVGDLCCLFKHSHFRLQRQRSLQKCQVHAWKIRWPGCRFDTALLLCQPNRPITIYVQVHCQECRKKIQHQYIITLSAEQLTCVTVTDCSSSVKRLSSHSEWREDCFCANSWLCLDRDGLYREWRRRWAALTDLYLHWKVTPVGDL